MHHARIEVQFALDRRVHKCPVRHEDDTRRPGNSLHHVAPAGGRRIVVEQHGNPRDAKLLAGPSAGVRDGSPCVVRRDSVWNTVFLAKAVN